MRWPADLVVATPRCLCWPPGNFYIDPSHAVSHAAIAHAHADHACETAGDNSAPARTLGMPA